MKHPFKSNALAHLKKANGQLARVIQMIEEDKYCIDIIQQNLATIGQLRSANTIILESHLNTCGGHALSSKNKKTQQAFIKELIQVCGMASR